MTYRINSPYHEQNLAHSVVTTSRFARMSSLARTVLGMYLGNMDTIQKEDMHELISFILQFLLCMSVLYVSAVLLEWRALLIPVYNLLYCSMNHVFSTYLFCIVCCV